MFMSISTVPSVSHEYIKESLANLENILCLKNVGKSYISNGKFENVLSQINLKIKLGETCAITGPSGSGKSTLLNIIGLLDFADEGDYSFMGHHVLKGQSNELASLRKSKVGFVFQNFNLINRLSVIENVALPLRYHETTRNLALKHARLMLQRVGMVHKADYKPADLSGGQKQRVAIARALVARPSLILADEPTGSLDCKTADEILELILSIQQEQAVTLLIVTHDPNVARLMQRQIRVTNGSVEEVISCTP